MLFANLYLLTRYLVLNKEIDINWNFFQVLVNILPPKNRRSLKVPLFTVYFVSLFLLQSQLSHSPDPNNSPNFLSTLLGNEEHNPGKNLYLSDYVSSKVTSVGSYRKVSQFHITLPWDAAKLVQKLWTT